MPSLEHEARLRRARREALFAALPLTLDLGPEAIGRLIPHRAPFLLIDRIVASDEHGRRARGERRLDPADPVFAGHFPGDPVYPGALLLEAGGQLGLCLGEALARGALPEQARSLRLIRVHGAEFVDAARPGDTLTILAEQLEDDGWTTTCACQVLRGERILAAAILEAMWGDP